MNITQQQIYLVVLFLVLLPGAGYLIMKGFFSRKDELQRLFEQRDGEGGSDDFDGAFEEGNGSGSQLSNIRKVGRRGGQAVFVEKRAPLEEQLFRAGYLRESERKLFYAAQFFLPLVLIVLFAYSMSAFGGMKPYLGGLMGLLLGLYLPRWYLERRIVKRDEEIMYFLPLVIEQFVIGVSSGLDIGPCIQRVVSIADERDTHNPVTELLRNVQLLTRSGTSLTDALEEVGTLVGHTELKHSFMTMGQVSRHGGEITKQLQELANAVSGQRETKVEERIKRLELHATGPVVLVFISFMAVLFVGIGMQLTKALGI